MVRKKRIHKSTVLACDHCQARKVRCVAPTVGGQCQACSTRGKLCTYMNPTQRSLRVRGPQVEALLAPRRSALQEGELENLVRFFHSADLPEARAVQGALPQLVAHASPVEFRFLVHSALAALFFMDAARSQPSPQAIHHYAMSVDHLLLIEASPHPHLMAPILALLEAVKTWASFLVASP